MKSSSTLQSWWSENKSSIGIAHWLYDHCYSCVNGYFNGLLKPRNGCKAMFQQESYSFSKLHWLKMLSLFILAIYAQIQPHLIYKYNNTEIRSFLQCTTCQMPSDSSYLCKQLPECIYPACQDPHWWQFCTHCHRVIWVRLHLAVFCHTIAHPHHSPRYNMTLLGILKSVRTLASTNNRNDSLPST